MTWAVKSAACRTSVVAGIAIAAWSLAGGGAITVGSESSLAAEGFAEARRLLASYCLDCHSSNTVEAEVDFSFTHDAARLGTRVKFLQRVEDMVTSGQMPPSDSDQPTDDERSTFTSS